MHDSQALPIPVRIVAIYWLQDTEQHNPHINFGWSTLPSSTTTTMNQAMLKCRLQGVVGPSTRSRCNQPRAAVAQARRMPTLPLRFRSSVVVKSAAEVRFPGPSPAQTTPSTPLAPSLHDMAHDVPMAFMWRLVSQLSSLSHRHSLHVRPACKGLVGCLC